VLTYSDVDVLMDAISDAFCGALGLASLGEVFPIRNLGRKIWISGKSKNMKG
jgi:2C-methyl-D-erythritol 2,4-cyclodiphosphate synthase